MQVWSKRAVTRNKSMQENGPAPQKTAQKSIIIHSRMAQHLQNEPTRPLFYIACGGQIRTPRKQCRLHSVQRLSREQPWEEALASIWGYKDSMGTPSKCGSKTWEFLKHWRSYLGIFVRWSPLFEFHILAAPIATLLDPEMA